MLSFYAVLKSSVEERRFAMARLMSFGLGLAAMAMKRLVALGLSRSRS